MNSEKIFLVLVILTFSFNSCNAKETQTQKSKQKLVNSVFVPDTSINGLLFLNNPSSIEKTIGGIMSFLNKQADLPYVYALSSTKEEYLKMVVFPGDNSNSVSMFEIGYASTLPSNEKKNHSTLSSFTSESKITLGMSKTELIKIKGNNYVEETRNKEQVVKYIIDDFDHSPFLKKYNMPIYIAEYSLKDNKIVKFRFGFEYP